MEGSSSSSRRHPLARSPTTLTCSKRQEAQQLCAHKLDGGHKARRAQQGRRATLKRPDGR
eukprot:6206981-Pleurochrysis_carterae.AAC.6